MIKLNLHGEQRRMLSFYLVGRRRVGSMDEVKGRLQATLGTREGSRCLSMEKLVCLGLIYQATVYTSIDLLNSIPNAVLINYLSE